VRRFRNWHSPIGSLEDDVITGRLLDGHALGWATPAGLIAYLALVVTTYILGQAENLAHLLALSWPSSSAFQFWYATAAALRLGMYAVFCCPSLSGPTCPTASLLPLS